MPVHILISFFFLNGIKIFPTYFFGGDRGEYGVDLRGEGRGVEEEGVGNGYYSNLPQLFLIIIKKGI